MNSEVSDGNSDDGWSLAGGNDSAPAPSDPSSLPSLVEKTFVVAASASDYVGGLKAFIGVVKEAYERGYTVPALTLEVSFVPTQTAGRPLAPDEVELRSVWIALVYLTLEKARWPQKKKRASEISSPFMDRFSVFVDNIMTAFAKGHTLDTLKVRTCSPQRAVDMRVPETDGGGHEERRRASKPDGGCGAVPEHAHCLHDAGAHAAGLEWMIAPSMGL
ncbi:unnamed protein product [Discosporangium mesarthrocarpum]